MRTLARDEENGEGMVENGDTNGVEKKRERLIRWNEMLRC